MADSIFSSSALLSGSSMSSLHSSEDAVNRLIELLLEDKIIHALCCKALSSIDRERFERNLRRLLKGFATELRKEAKSKEQRSASHFVALRATNSAHMICNKLNKTRTGKIARVPAAEKQDEVDGSDGSQSESSEDGLDGMQQLEMFIKTSQALQILRENLRSFVEQFDEQNRKGSNEKIENVEHVPVEESRCLEVQRPGRKDQEAETHWVQQVTAFCDDAIRIIFQRPGPVEAGKTRVEWQCKCGHKIFDDFIEIQGGAADRYKRTFDHSNNSSISSRRSTFSSVARTLSSGLGSVKSALSFGMKKSEEGGLPLHERCSPSNMLGQENSSVQIPEVPPPELLFLLLCYSEGRYATKLLQLDLVTLQATSDKALFKLLRCNYASMRGRLSSWFPLRTLVGIKFVQFELYRSLLVDVRKTDDVPPPTERNYRYRPAPPESVPPVGEKHLLHLFEHPECAEDDESCLSRFPKKLKEKLKCSGGVSPGWGLQFVEGWDTRKIWIIIFVFFGIGSLLIGVLWTVFEHSIQDAFSMAAYMVAFATVSVGTVQAILVM